MHSYSTNLKVVLIFSLFIWINPSISFSKSWLTELSKPCTLRQENTEQRETNEVPRWMSHTNHKITYTHLDFLGQHDSNRNGSIRAAIDDGILPRQCKWILKAAVWKLQPSQGILKGKYHCTIDLLFDWFGLVSFANKNKNCQ